MLTWNVQNAAPERARRQAHWLVDECTADVLVLTELRPSRGAHALGQILAEHGYEVFFPRSAIADHMIMLAVRGLVAEVVKADVDFLPHRFGMLRLTSRGNVLGVAGLYVPSRGPRARRNESKRRFQEAVSAYLPRLCNETDMPSVIVTGDLNVLEPDHRPHYRVFGEWEYRFYESFRGNGFIDAFRLLHPHADEYSWHGRGGNGYRFDHTFISAPLRARLRSCEYLHVGRSRGLSDHSVMVTDISPPTDITR